MIEKRYEIEGRREFDESGIDYYGRWENPCATSSQISYLMGVIKNHRFDDGSPVLKVAEVGVSAGMTSMYMLKAAAAREDFHLFGIEKAEGAFYGHMVFEECSEKEISKWTFCRGKTTFDAKSILKDTVLDLVFIDGMHAHPGALIDFLMLYPFMRKDGIVVLHDVEMYDIPSELGACYFYSGWRGKKRLNYYIDSDGEIHGTEYMGILELERDESELFSDLLEIAQQPITGSTFCYSSGPDPLGIEVSDIDITLRNFMNEYYTKEFADNMISVLIENLLDYKKKWIYYLHTNRRAARNTFEADSSKLDKFDFSSIDTLAIWGAGHWGECLMFSLSNRGENSKVVAWVDSKRTGERIFRPDILKEKDFRKLIIAVCDRQLFYGIRETAVSFGIPKDKILWLFDNELGAE